MTDTSSRSRVRAGVPAGGEFAAEQRAENDDLSVETAPVVRDMTKENKVIASAINRAISYGVLRRNPHRRDLAASTNVDEPIMVGRDTEGRRVYVTFDAAFLPREATTTDFQKIEGYWRVHAYARAIDEGDIRAKHFGPLSKFVEGLPGDTQAAEFASLPHLNMDIHKGTPKQAAEFATIFAEGTRTRNHSAARRKQLKIADDQGHKFGDTLIDPPDPASVERAVELLIRFSERKH